MKKIPISKPRIWGSELLEIEQALSDGDISGNARPVRDFEARFAAAAGRKHSISTANGTVAIELALRALELPAGAEILVPSYCMMSPVFAAIACGLLVKPVDIDDVWNMAPHEVERQITQNTCAILAVHNYGHCTDMPALERIAGAYHLPLIEDAAEAFGASLAGRLAGTFGDVSCFSLYANKAITTGEGGMIVTDRDDLAERLRFLRNLSFGQSLETQYEHSSVGGNYRLSAIQAAFGLGQLNYANAAIESKREIGLKYVDRLAKMDDFRLQTEKTGAVHAYWAIAGTLSPRASRFRKSIQQYMLDRGIETRRFFSPVHRHAPISHQIMTAHSAFGKADEIYRSGICLPSYIGMTDDEILMVCNTLEAAVGEVVKQEMSAQ